MPVSSPRRLLLALCTAALPAVAAIPTVINYQGRLTDGSPTPVPVNATVNMTFEIWDVAAGGTAGLNRLWLEPASGSTLIPVVDGIFSVQLGASAGGSSVPIPDTLFSAGDSRYLQVIVNGETLGPRQRITASGYANQAAYSLQADSATYAVSTDNSLALNGLASSSWQRALSPSACPAGQYLTQINQSGSRSCAAAQLTPPVALSGSIAAPDALLEASNSGSGPGLYGENASTTANAFGVHGRILSTTPGSFATAVRGENSGVGGSGVGVWGSHAGGGFGVYGTTAAGGRAVYGLAGTSGTGVYGSSPSGNGVFGTSTSGNGVSGSSSSGAGVQGVSASDTGVVGISNSTTGLDYGVSGSTSSTSINAAGVHGIATSVSGSVTGVYGDAIASASGAGVTGSGGQYGGWFSTTDGSTGAGVYGTSSGIGGYGVYGYATGSAGVGVSGGACCLANMYAGYFYGNVHVSGTLSKSAGSFKIDHPLDPDNKYLSHSFVESPDMKNFYDGVVTLDAKGEAEVVMPDWFGALNRDFRYQLTCIGGHAPVYIAEELKDNRFRIAGGRRGLKVSWAVTGIRHDAYAERYRIPVEQEKPAAERGYYLRPDAYGLPEERGINRARRPVTRNEHETREPGAADGETAPDR